MLQSRPSHPKLHEQVLLETHCPWFEQLPKMEQEKTEQSLEEVHPTLHKQRFGPTQVP